MAYEITVKKRFTGKVLRLLKYLEKEWGKTAADNFITVLEERIEALSQQPFIGTLSGI